MADEPLVLTPFHDVRGVQALAPQQGALGAGVSSAVVLGEDGKLVLGGEAPERHQIAGTVAARSTPQTEERIA
jgi:hypothetical protein